MLNTGAETRRSSLEGLVDESNHHEQPSEDDEAPNTSDEAPNTSDEHINDATHDELSLEFNEVNPNPNPVQKTGKARNIAINSFNLKRIIKSIEKVNWSS